MTNVVALKDDNPVIRAQPEIEHAISHVHCVNAPGPAFQENCRETAMRCANVECDSSGNDNSESIQRPLQLERAAPWVHGWFLHGQELVSAHLPPHVGADFPGDPHAACHDVRTGQLLRMTQRHHPFQEALPFAPPHERRINAYARP